MKQVIFSLFFSFVFLTADAQESGPIFGIETQVGRHKLRISDSYQDAFSQVTGVSYNTSKGTGIGGGLRIGYNFGEYFSILLAPSAVQKPIAYETAENGEFEFLDRDGAPFTAVGFVKWKEVYTSVHIPLMLRATIPIGGRFGLTFSGGGGVNVLVKGKGEAVIETQAKTIPVDDYTIKFGKSRTDDYNNINASVVFAPGFVFKLDDEGRFRLFVEARFDVGLKDMYTEKRKDFLEAEGIDILGTRKMSSTFFTLGAEYTLPTWN